MLSRWNEKPILSNENSLELMAFLSSNPSMTLAEVTSDTGGISLHCYCTQARVHTQAAAGSKDIPWVSSDPEEIREFIEMIEEALTAAQEYETLAPALGNRLTIAKRRYNTKFPKSKPFEL